MTAPLCIISCHVHWLSPVLKCDFIWSVEILLDIIIMELRHHHSDSYIMN